MKGASNVSSLARLVMGCIICALALIPSAAAIPLNISGQARYMMHDAFSSSPPPINTAPLFTAALQGGVPVTYTWTMTADRYFAYLIFNVSTTAVDIKVTFSSSSGTTTISARVASATKQHLLVYPAVLAKICSSNSCPLTLQLNATADTFVRCDGYQGMVLQGNEMAAGTLDRNLADYYGFTATKDLLPTLCQLTPNQDRSQTDLDLYMFTATNLKDYWHPSDSSRNHYRNAVEEAVIDTGFDEDFYIAEVFVPGMDTPFDANTYTMSFLPNYNQSVSLATSLFGIIGALLILVICLFSSAAIIARRRRRDDIMAMQMQQNMHNVVSGASDEQIEGLPLKEYKVGLMPAEDAKCAICLADYVVADPLRQLPCDHYFHKGCVDEWLKRKKHCPLCQQDIENAHNVKSPEAAAAAGPPAGVVIVPVTNGATKSDGGEEKEREDHAQRGGAAAPRSSAMVIPDPHRPETLSSQNLPALAQQGGQYGGAQQHGGDGGRGPYWQQQPRPPVDEPETADPAAYESVPLADLPPMNGVVGALGPLRPPPSAASLGTREGL